MFGIFLFLTAHISTEISFSLTHALNFAFMDAEREKEVLGILELDTSL